jgi:hypothetical protein
MTRAARVYGLAGLLLFVSAWMALSPVSGQPAPQQITTDTPQYCLVLLDRVSELVRGLPSPPPQEVTNLSAAGQQMCDQGQTRGGIMRLREALVLLQAQQKQR